MPNPRFLKTAKRWMNKEPPKEKPKHQIMPIQQNIGLTRASKIRQAIFSPIDLEAIVHGRTTWQHNVIDHLSSWGIKIKPEDVLSKQDYRNYKNKYGYYGY